MPSKVRPAFWVRSEALSQYATRPETPVPVKFEPPMQTLEMEKQPAERLIPLAKVEVAEVPVMFKYAALTPAVKVEVALPETVRVVPTFSAPVVVAFVMVAFRAVKFPTVVEPVA